MRSSSAFALLSSSRSRAISSSRALSSGRTAVADGIAAMDMFVFAGFPKNIVIGKNGEIVYWRSTIAAWDKFESVIRTEIGK